MRAQTALALALVHTAFALALAHTAFALALTGAEPRGQHADATERDAARLVAVADALDAALEGALWPGFSLRAIPLALYEPGGTALLFHADEPPDGFERDAALDLCRGPAPAGVSANTSAPLDGRVTAFVRLDALGLGDAIRASQLVLVFHEASHAYRQRAPEGGEPRWPAENAMLVARYPAEDAANNAWGQLEGALLAKALRAPDDAELRRAATDFVAVRDARRALLEPALVAFEDHAELNEGLAELFGRKAVALAGELDAAELDAAGLDPAGIDAAELGFDGRDFADLVERVGRVNVLGAGASRQRFYETGAALGFVLDRVRPGWPAEVESERGATLTGLLRASVPVPDEGHAAVVAERLGLARRLARETDLADALAARRGRALDEAWGGPGRRLVVDLSAAGGAGSMTSFDPLNVTALEPGVQLHTRMLSLAFDGGNAQLTRPALQDLGTDVVVTTLEEPVELAEDGLRAPGVVLAGRAAVRESEALVLWAPGRGRAELDAGPWKERIERARAACAEPLPAPRWSARDLAGAEHGSREDTPRTTVLFFFSAAPWAGPSQAEQRALAAALGDGPRASDALRVLFVGAQSTEAELRAYLGADARLDHVLADEDRFLQRAFGVGALPAWVEVDPAGRIVLQRSGRGALGADELVRRLR